MIKINIDEDIDKQIIEKFKSEHILDFNKTTIQEVREKKLRSTETYDEYPCTIKKETFKLGDDLGSVDVLFFCPNEFDKRQSYSAVYYIHGGGWCLGGGNHKLPREICFRTNSIVIYPLYILAPEAKFPIAIEECYGILCKLEKESSIYNIDFNTLVVGGDSEGGNIAIALSILCKQRNGPKFKNKF
ncbi:hypothetical protein DICPUDRAFT_74670 [Dictyostelium purpureum]|uniref:Alpha/beta hydrolase fold-3 domain-containing protein n=1 Tax=Dictyostelium purpureum TaxID=5786 RepID=F0Z8F0_DICPU|nr:uncharacterized protein DICPUDRAFT_74670 [Dictyostelium purpureum]EGC39802.1 hypothetical protein DICPUDRAFT_74670 [Dictyostelium purpureum]|eukprot:XP_003283669.1 hypothetical protein DICPUDRAFT_74670 [Dictyostelium purpureum]